MGTELEEILKKKGIKSVVVVGTAAHGAVLYTASGAALRGMKVYIPVDGLSADSLYRDRRALSLADADRLLRSRIVLDLPARGPAGSARRSRCGWRTFELEGGGECRSYDAVEGDLTSLRDAQGDYSLVPSACVADDLASTELSIAEPGPAPGEGTWYLVRGERGGCRGTFGERVPSLHSARDLAVCP